MDVSVRLWLAAHDVDGKHSVAGATHRGRWHVGLWFGCACSARADPGMQGLCGTCFDRGNGLPAGHHHGWEEHRLWSLLWMRAWLVWKIMVCTIWTCKVWCRMWAGCDNGCLHDITVKLGRWELQYACTYLTPKSTHTLLLISHNCWPPLPLNSACTTQASQILLSWGSFLFCQLRFNFFFAKVIQGVRWMEGAIWPMDWL